MDSSELSLIPYSSTRRDIILRHGSSVVTYDEKSRSVTLHNAAQDLDLYGCPYCHRPFSADAGHESTQADPNGSLGGDAGSFIDPSYFRKLHQSREVSQQSSRSPSPKRLTDARHAAERQQGRGGHAATVTEDVDETAASSSRISPDAFQEGYFKSFFVEVAELGRGGKGVVLLVKHVLNGLDVALMACKRVPVGDDSQWLRKVLMEVQLLQGLSHKNIVSYQHVWLENFQITKFGPSVPCAFILQQYCNGGDLHHYIFGSSKAPTMAQMKSHARRRSRGQYNEPDHFGRPPRHMHFDEIFSFFKDITSGLHYLHSNGFIHRDLKPSNCLLHHTAGRTRVLISDFGETQRANSMRSSTGGTGTISFCAPEVLKLQPDTDELGNFTEKSDVFSLGLIVHLMCFGRLPYVHSDGIEDDNENVERLREEISTWTGMTADHAGRSDLPDELYERLKKLLAVNPLERPTTEQILETIKTHLNFADASTYRASSPEGASTINQQPIKGSSAFEPPGGVEMVRKRSKPGSGIPVLPPPRPSSSHSQRSISYRSSSIEETSRELIPSPTKTHVDSGQYFPEQRPWRERSQRPIMLLPAPVQTWTARSLGVLNSPTSKSVIKLTILCLKIASMLNLCKPDTPSAWVFYPLLLAASLDLIYPSGTLFLSLVLITLHAIVLYIMANPLDAMCERLRVAVLTED